MIIEIFGKATPDFANRKTDGLSDAGIRIRWKHISGSYQPGTPTRKHTVPRWQRAPAARHRECSRRRHRLVHL